MAVAAVPGEPVRSRWNDPVCRTCTGRAVAYTGLSRHEQTWQEPAAWGRDAGSSTATPGGHSSRCPVSSSMLSRCSLLVLHTYGWCSHMDR